MTQRKKRPKLYDEVLKFEVQPRTYDGLVSRGGRFNLTEGKFTERPGYIAGMVQLKGEKGGVVSFGLGTSNDGLKYFNGHIMSVSIYNRSTCKWEILK